MARYTTKDMESAVANFAAAIGKKVGVASHYEGEKYITAKNGTVRLHSGDARLGRIFAIIEHCNNGCIRVLYGYSNPAEIVAFCEGVVFSKSFKKGKRP